MPRQHKTKPGLSMRIEELESNPCGHEEIIVLEDLPIDPAPNANACRLSSIDKISHKH
jgi:hypothetical protein